MNLVGYEHLRAAGPFACESSIELADVEEDAA